MNLRFWLLTLLGAFLLATSAFGGAWTTNQFAYKPALGARGEAEKAVFDSGLDRVDARLGKEYWVGDPALGATLQDAVTALGGTTAVLRLPAGTHAIDDALNVPANITLAPERGAVISITIPDADIEGMTRAWPCVVTWTGHGLSTGDKVYISGVTQSGWQYLNGGTFSITKINDNSFSILADTSNTTYYPAVYDAGDPGVISKVIDIRGGLLAGDYQVFDAAPGKVALSGANPINPKWWGAVPDGATDCTEAIQAALAALPLNLGGEVHFGPGVYYLASQVELPGIVTTADQYVQVPIKITGDGTILYTDQDIALLHRKPENEKFANRFAYAVYLVEGLKFEGTSSRAQVGLDLGCTNSSKITRCQFCSLGIGLRLTYAMFPEVSWCLAKNNVICTYDTHSGRDLWGWTSTYTTNTGIFRYCAAYLLGATQVNIADMTAANPCVVTWNGHGLADGDVIFIDGITQANWTALNHRRFKVGNKTANNFELYMMDGTTSVDTSTFGAYVPATDPGKYAAWTGGFRLVNSPGITLDACITQGGNPVDDVFIDTVTLAQTANYLILSHHTETSPVGSTFYLRYYGGRIDMEPGTGNGGSTTCSIDAYDTSTGASGLINLNGYVVGNGAKIRVPGDSTSQHLTWNFQFAGSASLGLDMHSTAYWWNSVVVSDIFNRQVGYHGFQDTSPNQIKEAAAYFYFRKKSISGYGTYYGLRAEAISDGTGGLGVYDTANSQTTLLRQKASEITITASGTNVQDVSNFIPAGSMVIGFTARVTTAIGGASDLSIGTTVAPTLWISAMGVALGSTGNLTKATSTGPVIYPSATTVRLQGNGNFDGTGKVRITCHYITLEAPGS
jgi:hypothetical protein